MIRLSIAPSSNHIPSIPAAVQVDVEDGAIVAKQRLEVDSQAARRVQHGVGWAHVLLQLNLAALDIQKLVFEESFMDACKRKVIFPHLYSTLMLCQVSKSWILKGEAFCLPEEVMLEFKNI